MSLKIRQNGVPLRIVLLEVDGANVDEILRPVLDEDISRDRDSAVCSPILE